MVFGEGILKRNDWSTNGNGKGEIRAEKSWNLNQLLVPFVIKYNPKLQETASIMKKYQNILNQDETVEQVFTPLTMISYRNARKLGSYLVHAKLYPLEQKRGS